MADLMSKGTENESEVEDRRRAMNDIETFLQTRKIEPGVSAQRTLLNGNDIMSVFPQIDPKTGFINDVQDRLVAEQDSGTIQTKEQALAWLNSIQGDIVSNYPSKTSGWYVKIKTADASSGQGPDGYGGDTDFLPKQERDEDFSMVEYSVPAPFDVGDIVRERRGGIGDEPMAQGEVVDNDDHWLVIEWKTGKRKGKKSRFNMLDAARLALTIERIV